MPGKDLKLNGSPAEQLVEVYEKLIEPTLIDPTYVTHVPCVIIPLARKARMIRSSPTSTSWRSTARRFRPGYTELNDPDIQAANFTHQVGDKKSSRRWTRISSTASIRHAAGGRDGLGIDRLVMMLTGAESHSGCDFVSADEAAGSGSEVE